MVKGFFYFSQRHSVVLLARLPCWNLAEVVQSNNVLTGTKILVVLWITSRKASVHNPTIFGKILFQMLSIPHVPVNHTVCRSVLGEITFLGS